MSTLRNIAAHLWRGSIVRKANIVLGITGATLSAACAADSVVAPIATRTTRSTPGTAFDMSKPGTVSKAAQDSIKQYTKAQMDSLQTDWQAYKSAVHAGLVDAEFVRCAPKPVVTVTKVIGPKGGALKIGPHTFEVPAGALDSNVAITATAPMNSRLEIQFEPHGLQFGRPVRMTMSYKGCIVPDGALLGVAYMGREVAPADSLQGIVRALMPTSDDKGASAVSALTDHFSGYTVTWGRQ
ncbi:MAG TPA: hypothetical protein VGD56_07440 [Gemmatirosa sp.]